MPDMKTMKSLVQVWCSRYMSRYFHYAGYNPVSHYQHFLILITLCLYPFLLHAEQSKPIETPASWYGYVYLGDNAGGTSTGSLQSTSYISSPLEWGIGLGRYYRDLLSVEGAFEYWGERYERTGTIIPGTENNVIQAGGLALSATVLGHLHRNDWHVYAGVGAGYYITGILVTEPGSGLLTTQGAPSDQWIPGLHLSLGADYRIKENHKLGIEMKKRRIKADFGAYTNGEVDLGGTLLLFTYRYDSR